MRGTRACARTRRARGRREGKLGGGRRREGIEKVVQGNLSLGLGLSYQLRKRIERERRGRR